MKITDVKRQARRQDRYSIYVDGKYVFSLSETELLNSGLRINLELAADDLTQLKDTAKLDKAYDRALNCIAIRRRSEWEIREYLKRKEYGPEIIEEILPRLQDKGYIDDLAFAKAWVANRRLLKATSKRRLQQELRAKRVSDDSIQQALEEDETDEQAVLKDLVAKKRQQSRYQDDLKLMQYLSRQGYNYDDIKQALSEQ
jgi:regulatory protein